MAGHAGNLPPQGWPRIRVPDLPVPNGEGLTTMRTPTITLALLVSAHVAHGDATGVCSKVAHQLDTMLDHSGTLCLPGQTSDRRKGWTTFVLVAPRPVVGPASARSAYGVYACAAFGKALNDDRSVQADELWISDTTLVRQGQAYAMKLRTCQQLQPKVQAGMMSIDDMRSTIAGALQPKSYTPP